MDHLYSLPYGAQPPADSVPAMTPEARQKTERKRRLVHDQRAKTRVNIGFAFPRWRALRTRLGIEKDAELALVLLDSLSKKRVQEEAGILDPQNEVINCKDSWETASEESASDEDCVASISLRLCSRPADDSDGRGERTEEE